MNLTPDTSRTNPKGTRADRGRSETIAATLRQNQGVLRKGRDKHLHSKEHVLADDLSQSMREPKRFAAYLGIAQLYYESDLRALARRVTEKEDLPTEARGKYFFAALKGLSKKPDVKFKKRRSKKPKNGEHKRYRKRTKQNSPKKSA